MNKNNLITILFLGVIALAAVLGCKSLGTSSETPNASNTASSNSVPTPVSNTASQTNSTSKVEPADITITSEDLDKEFRDKNAKRETLEAKYANKNIAVTGRITLLQTEKKDTVGPWLKLYAPGSLAYGVTCYFDDENASQASNLKRDKIVKVQGFQDGFIVPGISPRLKHCVVLEAE